MTYAAAMLALPCMGLLAGCVAYGPEGLAAGTPRAQLEAALGPPTAVHALPAGAQQLEYSRGPMGHHAYMLYLSPEGRLQRWEQVLQPAVFAGVQDGMSTQALRRLLGRPAHVMGVRGGEVWSWRYANNDCLWFRVDVGETGTVKHGGSYGTDPLCDVNDITRE